LARAKTGKSGLMMQVRLSRVQLGADPS
jgi:hypothetical protein